MAAAVFALRYSRYCGFALRYSRYCNRFYANGDDRKLIGGNTMQSLRLWSTVVLLTACAAVGVVPGASIGRAQNLSAVRALPLAKYTPPLLLVQNALSPYTVQQTPEIPVSPINPGTLPGSTAAIGGSATGTNPITGLPCNGSGSISVSGAGGLPATATPPPGLSTETLDQIPVGTPPVTSIYGSQNNLGSC
jgi:hypothetical protein